ncbi:MAG: MFS transporter [Rhodoplanes sp.]
MMGPARPAAHVNDVTVLVATLGAAYVASMFLRNSIGVIAPNLADDLALTGPEIALVSSIFFFAFVAAQIPLGIAIDRYGPKRCMLVCAVVTVLSTLLFAGATGFVEMIVARVLMGLGTSCFLMAPLALYARTFPPDRFSVLAGLQLGIGAAGGLLATAPLAYATAAIGWRASFAVIAAAMAGLGLLVAGLIRDGAKERAAESGRESLMDSLRGVAGAWRFPDVGRLFLLNLSAYSSYVLVIGLWGGPYLTHVYGYDLKERGTLLFVAAATQVLGMIAWGATGRLFNGYKLAVYSGCGSTLALLLVVGLAGTLPPVALWGWFAAFGACSAFMPVVIAHGKALFPTPLVGRGITLLNMGTMGGGFVSQFVSGFVLELYPAQAGAYPLAAYRAIFLLQAGFAAIGLLFYRSTREPTR